MENVNSPLDLAEHADGDTLYFLNDYLPTIINDESQLKTIIPRLKKNYFTMYKNRYFVDLLNRDIDRDFRFMIYYSIDTLNLHLKNELLPIDYLYNIAKKYHKTNGGQIENTDFYQIRPIIVSIMTCAWETGMISKEMVGNIVKFMRMEDLKKQLSHETKVMLDYLFIQLFEVLEKRKNQGLILDLKEDLVQIFPYIFKYVGTNSKDTYSLWIANLKKYYGDGIFRESNSFQLFYEWISTSNPISINNAINLINIFGLDYVEVSRDIENITQVLIDKLRVLKTSNIGYHFNLVKLLANLLEYHPTLRSSLLSRGNSDRVADSVIKALNVTKNSQSVITQEELQKSMYLVDLFLSLNKDIINKKLSEVFLVALPEGPEPQEQEATDDSKIQPYNEKLPGRLVNEIAYRLFVLDKRFKASKWIDLYLKKVSRTLEAGGPEAQDYVETFLYFRPQEAEALYQRFYLSKTKQGPTAAGRRPHQTRQANNLVSLLGMYTRAYNESDRYKVMTTQSIAESGLFKELFAQPWYHYSIPRYIRHTSQVHDLIENGYKPDNNAEFFRYCLDHHPREFKEHLANWISIGNVSNDLVQSLPAFQRIINIDFEVKAILLNSRENRRYLADQHSHLLFTNHCEFPQIYIDFVARMEDFNTTVFNLHINILKTMAAVQLENYQLNTVNIQFLMAVIQKGFEVPVQCLIGIVKLVNHIEEANQHIIPHIHRCLLQGFAAHQQKSAFLEEHDRFESHFLAGVLYDPERNGGLVYERKVQLPIIERTNPQVQNLIYQKILSYLFGSLPLVIGYNATNGATIFRCAMVSKLFFSITSKLISMNLYCFSISPAVSRVYSPWSLLKNGIHRVSYIALEALQREEVNEVFYASKYLVIDTNIHYTANRVLNNLYKIEIENNCPINNRRMQIRLCAPKILQIISQAPNMRFIKIKSSLIDIGPEELNFLSALKDFPQLRQLNILIIVRYGPKNLPIKQIYERLSQVKAANPKFNFKINLDIGDDSYLDLVTENHQYLHSSRIGYIFKENLMLDFIMPKLAIHFNNSFSYQLLCDNSKFTSPLLDCSTAQSQFDNLLNTKDSQGISAIQSIRVSHLKVHISFGVDIRDTDFNHLSQYIKKITVLSERPIQESLITPILKSISQTNSSVQMIKFINNENEVFNNITKTYGFYQYSKYKFLRKPESN